MNYTNFDKLSVANKKFVVAYLQTLNATASYKIVRPATKHVTARQKGSELLKREDIQAAIIELSGVKPTDVLNRLQAILAFDILEYYDKKIDLERLKNDGYGWIVKKVLGNGNVELMDKDKALEIYAKASGLFNENNVTVNIENKVQAQDLLNEKLDDLAKKLNEAIDI